MKLKETAQMPLEEFERIVCRLDAWSIGFARAYIPKIEDYMATSSEQRALMPNPLPIKKTRVMFRVTRLLLSIRSARQAGLLPDSLRIVCLDGGPVPEHYHGLVPLTNAALGGLREDLKALKRVVR